MFLCLFSHITPTHGNVKARTLKDSKNCDRLASVREALREPLSALVVLAIATFPGCAEDAGPSLTLDVRIAASLGPYGLCLSSTPDQLPHLPIDPSNVTQVRLTVLAPADVSTPERFVCDRVIPVGGGNETEILIPSQSPVVDLVVEAYGG